MAMISRKCKNCGKKQSEKSHFIAGPEMIITLSCGHTYVQRMISQTGDAARFHTAEDESKPFGFQAEGIRAIEKSNGRIIIADEMGLGKTRQALTFISLHRKEVLPCLIIVKASLVRQWEREIVNITGDAVCILDSGKSVVGPGFKIYITTYDLAPKLQKAIVEKLDLKLVVLDEVQQIKNPEANRTNAVRDIVRDVPYLISMSGTPIKNQGLEYFTALNMTAPHMFPSYQGYINTWLQSEWTGYGWKTGGIKREKLQDWQDYTKEIIVRRTRAEVLPDLPKVWRKSQFSELGDIVENAYRQAMEEFVDEFDELEAKGKKATGVMNLLQYMSKMRHITGIAKVQPTAELILEHLEETDRKITIFVHHQDVMEMLRYRLDEAGIKPLIFHSGLNSEQRLALVDRFREDSESRVLIASTLAAGEGINLQFCSDAIMLERQWNPSNEEQAEGRFTRIGSVSDKVDVTYMVAVGTIDEYFAEIVEKKRGILKSFAGESAKWDESSIMMELAETLATKGRKKWNLK